ncbi:hypothetical protein QN219_18595 [Sinorhizobium sp. 7-81]|uniref:hypothetical protein n=1 Tax=Sinorhizobium sp. 8-89 TaxID=3049089 RepID=UPI0024C3B45C|nr:hypothetical protein [Sinorhizobium sp. 8-89]MDK1492051.1 hypothetical protein [Sinorhizobium sp. 8-89]
MLDERQKLLLEEEVRRVLQEFDQSGAAFTPSMLISAMREAGRLADGNALDEDDAEAFVADVVNRRLDELEGRRRQIVSLESEPEQKWGFKDA